MIKLYNSQSRQIERFKPLHKRRVSLYACGPTVYDYQHIGNMRRFVFHDLLKRVLDYNGYTVYSVMNITDVGHLASDADEGKDKMQLGAERERKTAWEVAAFYEDAFFQDLERLHIRPDNHYPHATAYIPEQRRLIQKLEQAGYTYLLEDGVYFDTSQFPAYGKLSTLDTDQLQEGARVSLGDKKNPTDFALWKFSPADKQRDMEWDSPWGKGFPGWHTECVVMSNALLHAPFDIHTGGKDHLATHHPNEIAQFEALHSQPLARYWLHSYFLTLKDEKMSKSAGTFVILPDLLEAGFSPLDFRFFCLQGHYRSDLSFSYFILTQSARTLTRLRAFLSRVHTQTNRKNPEIMPQLKKLQKDFRNAVNNDLDTPQALAKIFDFIHDVNKRLDAGEDIPQRHIEKMFMRFDRVLGLHLFPLETEDEVPSEIHQLATEREEARQRKDFATADHLRDQIHEQGYEIQDTAEGPVITRRNR